MANVDIQLGFKDSAWFTTNATLVLKTGQTVYLSGTAVRFKRGDGVTDLQTLEWNDDNILATLLTAFSSSTNEQLTASDTLLQALQKLQAQTSKPVTISASNIDFTAGTHFSKTLSANTTFTFSGDVNSHTIIIKLVQGASAYTVTWPAGVKWSGGTEPVMTATPGAVDVYTLVKIDGDIMGSYIQNMS